MNSFLFASSKLCLKSISLNGLFDIFRLTRKNGYMMFFGVGLLISFSYRALKIACRNEGLILLVFLLKFRPGFDSVDGSQFS